MIAALASLLFAQAAAGPLPAAPADAAASAGQAQEQGQPEAPEPQGYTPPDASASQPALRIGGYADVGFARAQGDGSSFAPGDTRVPADYGVDAFAPAVNSRGDVASTDTGGRFTNGFLPRSLGLGGRSSFFVSTADLDVRYAPATAPVLLFARVQFLPRFSSRGDASRVLVEQAFARVTPLGSQELAVSVGKFDSVFGIEYLENEANLRTGVTPSLIARYTTGQSLGAKAFYRLQLPTLWTALSLNVAATNGGTMVEPLQPADSSLTGTPVLSARLGLEVNLPRVEVKLGVSALDGPRNDQTQPGVRQKALGGDARLVVPAPLGSLELRGELIALRQDEGEGDKLDSLGPQTVVSRFKVGGGYLQASYAIDANAGALRRVSLYGRYEKRHAQFEGYTPITVDRITAGARLDLWESLALKGEALFNRELEGAPDVRNDVLTSSLVFAW